MNIESLKGLLTDYNIAVSPQARMSEKLRQDI